MKKVRVEIDSFLFLSIFSLQILKFVVFSSFCRFLSDPNYNYEAISRASYACGPLVKWAIAQLSYSNMLTQVGPLRNELKKLEEKAVKNKREYEEVEDIISKLRISSAK